MSRKNGIVIVDDHPLFREGVKGLVERSDNYCCIGEAGGGAEALRLALELAPELMTMDVSLPDMSGIDAVREIVQAAPSVKILMLTMHHSLDYVKEAFTAGARGYLVKEATSTRMIQAMDALCAGECFLDGLVSREMVEKLISGGDEQRSPSDRRYALLSPREQQVMRLIAEGVASREIAASLALSLKTVENHRNNLMKKLDVHSQIELVKYAARLGVIDLEQWR